MNDPLLMWSDQVGAAQNDEDRRALLTKLATWRAQNLTNIPATRRATYTVARLFQRMGMQGKAETEARNLMSLFRTPPEAKEEELASIHDLMGSLGMSESSELTVTGAERRRDRRRGRDNREPREQREPREAREPRERRDAKGSPTQDARNAAADGNWEGVLKATEGARGASAIVLRAFALLSAALEGPEEERATKVEDVRLLLGRAGGLRNLGGGDDALSALIGEPVPTRRGARMRVLEAFADANPDKLDELAEAALQHHVSTSGPGVAAPWLVGLVGAALASTSGEKVQAAIAKLRSEKSVAVAAYDEWPFERLQRLTRRAAELGHEVGSLRRGVLAREEPDDRKLWTLRLMMEGTERMLVVGPHATVGYGKGKAEMLAARLEGLCSRALLLATGSGNEELRERAQAHGLGVEAHDADDDALLAALAVAGRAPEPAAPPPPERLVAALEAETFDPELVKAAVADFRRPDRALRPVLRMELTDEQTAVLLTAVHGAADAQVAIPEGTTLGIRMAAHGEATRTVITESEAANRFGGPGVDVVIALTRTLLDDGWQLHRVLRGPTRRESRLHPAVETLAPHMSGLWRMLVRRGDQRGEVWYVAELPAEGRAAVPLLLLEDHHRMVVLPSDDGLSAWWGELAGAPEALTWTGEEVDAVLTAAGAFPAVQEENGVDENHGAAPEVDAANGESEAS